MLTLAAMIERGRRPWVPATHARDLDVWFEIARQDGYRLLDRDVPMAGTFMLGSSLFLFVTISRPDDEPLPPTEPSGWAYMQIDAHRAARLRSHDRGSMGDAFDLQREMIGTEIVLAVAVNYGLECWATMYVQEDGVCGCARNFFDGEAFAHWVDHG